MKEHYPYAFVSFLIKNDSYLPGALLLGYSLRKQDVIADLVCIVTEDVSGEAVTTLRRIYDFVFRLPSIHVKRLGDQKRQYLPFVFTRIHALRLGADGDLGCRYEKVIILDADILPIRGYQQLFLLKTPAGILNEKKENAVSATEPGNCMNGIWEWHVHYKNIPHGSRIPKSITDRVIFDTTNYGINTALLVLRPSMDMFVELSNDLNNETIVDYICKNYKWPDMQFLTLKWSGYWHNVDISYASFHGYPNLGIINGNHYIGLKPWQLKNKSVQNKFSRYEDYRYWYEVFIEMTDENPEITGNKYIDRLKNGIMKLNKGTPKNHRAQRAQKSSLKCP